MNLVLPRPSKLSSTVFVAFLSSRPLVRSGRPLCVLPPLFRTFIFFAAVVHHDFISRRGDVSTRLRLLSWSFPSVDISFLLCCTLVRGGRLLRVRRPPCRQLLRSGPFFIGGGLAIGPFSSSTLLPVFHLASIFLNFSPGWQFRHSFRAGELRILPRVRHMRTSARSPHPCKILPAHLGLAPCVRHSFLHCELQTAFRVR